ncbi:hypothetical protein L2E82_38827 [Cichorium intybus]|uniref:Uncharacterized protein n=1 Tax=Cichorium intybus TaxID=13427 RepID=A0ACB9AHG0_CICIN|nr:hypothetical protein L2E82_38827 [Cichorium intybus]
MKHGGEVVSGGGTKDSPSGNRPAHRSWYQQYVFRNNDSLGFSWRTSTCKNLQKKGKGQPNSLTPSEKLELWDRLKILSFTRMVLSIWAMTTISLFVRIQVNILGRHLYIDTAHHLGGLQPLSLCN